MDAGECRARAGDGTPNAARNETPYEQADRNFAELLQELRVTQTGVQILFAFLLTLAFTERFPDLDAYQRGTYLTTLLLAVLAAALFTAPAALHRTLFGRGAKRLIVDVSSRLAAYGLAVLALALAGAVTLVVDVVLGRAAGALTGGLALLTCAGLWAVLPWALRRGAGVP
ncbi:DUF6328 family protein [Streptomyces sp. Z26]|uniref:DUF6328 family protein n=1 Tax=Streptomyces TaxID=1883 RepID=UPI000EF16BA9|nr:DUF6328 family protein [Streptomyces sp. Z26]RLL65614.1 hypothetical protein D7M15_00425 [Streptomyces sp. Z26]